jgi:hypothetical protein
MSRPCPTCSRSLWERYVPHVVFERLQADIPKDDLIKVLYWVATHPNGGDDSAVDDLRSAGLKVNGPSDMDQTRERVMLYALKLLGRLVGENSAVAWLKSQAPNPKLPTHAQLQKIQSKSTPNATGSREWRFGIWGVGWDLGFGGALGFGIWSLGFAVIAVPAATRAPAHPVSKKSAHSSSAVELLVWPQQRL